jgi:hypothetical protein
MEAQVKKWGNSKAIIIPNCEAEKWDVKIGDKVDVAITKKTPISGFGILKGKKLIPFKRDHGWLDRDIA